MLAQYFIDKDIAKDAVVVSPDHGGVARARAMAEYLKVPLAIIDKRRPKANVAEIMNIIGNVQNKKCIMIDDIIDTAGTICLGGKALKDAGASQVYACCSHAVLSGEAINRLENSVFEKVVVTDSIKLSDDKQIDKLVQVTVAPLLGDAIKRINDNQPVSPLFTHNKNNNFN